MFRISIIYYGFPIITNVNYNFSIVLICWKWSPQNLCLFLHSITFCIKICFLCWLTCHCVLFAMKMLTLSSDVLNDMANFRLYNYFFFGGGGCCCGLMLFDYCFVLLFSFRLCFISVIMCIPGLSSFLHNLF